MYKKLRPKLRPGEIMQFGDKTENGSKLWWVYTSNGIFKLNYYY